MIWVVKDEGDEGPQHTNTFIRRALRMWPSPAGGPVRRTNGRTQRLTRVSTRLSLLCIEEHHLSYALPLGVSSTFLLAPPGFFSTSIDHVSHQLTHEHVY